MILIKLITYRIMFHNKGSYMTSTVKAATWRKTAFELLFFGVFAGTFVIATIGG